jgi:hypothetical protein
MAPARRPGFAKDYPHHPDLDAVVEAFGQGDYAKVRALAPSVERASSDPAVRAAARELADRTNPDRVALLLFAMAALLLAVIGSWWLGHGH